MTYDFSSLHRPGIYAQQFRIGNDFFNERCVCLFACGGTFVGPNSPILWMEDCVKVLTSTREKRDKVLLGFNFYGYDYPPVGGGPIINRDYIKTLKDYKVKFEIDEKSAEHYFQVK